MAQVKHKSEAIRVKATKVRIRVDSEDVHIPELKKFIGKTVEMIIAEVPPILPREGKSEKMKHFFEAAGKIDIDEEVIRQWREVSKW